MASWEEPPPLPPRPREGGIQLSRPEDDLDRMKVARKPVKSGSSSTTQSTAQHDESDSPYPDTFGLDLEKFRELDIGSQDLALNTSIPDPFIDSQITLSPGSTNTETPNTIYSTLSSSSLSSFTTPNSNESSDSSSIQKAYREARHFAGGLITHPFTSTKHYTILRHSHGLVFYQGTSTTLAVSIFADEPLPAERTIWLQSKGWTGNTGMRLKAFVGRNASWYNVTPSARVLPEQLKPTDERAWQRDFKQFAKKQNRGPRQNHVLRETCIVRLPSEAGDGYFQLILCLGEKVKVLCSSPTFRLLSTSTSPHSIKGASLGTLPFEVGAMALGLYAKKTAGKVVAPVTSIVQSRIQSYMPSFWAREAFTTAYGASGIGDKVDSTLGDANHRYEQVRDGAYVTFGGQDFALDYGPQAPYPLQFTARVDPLTISTERFSLPTINLTGLSETIYRKLDGYYFAWARYLPNEKSKINFDAQDSWVQALVSALPVDVSQMSRVSIEEANKRTFSLHLILDSEEISSDQPWMEVLVMGFIRPDEPLQRANLARGLRAEDEAAMEAAMLTEYDDISMAQSILDHPAWSPESVSQKKENLPRPSTLERAKSSYAETRLSAQHQVERLALHRVGVRTPSDPMRDKTVIVNGFYVVR